MPASKCFVSPYIPKLCFADDDFMITYVRLLPKKPKQFEHAHEERKETSGINGCTMYV